MNKLFLALATVSVLSTGAAMADTSVNVQAGANSHAGGFATQVELPGVSMSNEFIVSPKDAVDQVASTATKAVKKVASTVAKAVKGVLSVFN